MPNWCENELTVTGPADVLQRFVEIAGSDAEPLRLGAFIPRPELLTRAGDAWHDWSLCHWGTKWDLGLGQVRRELQHDPDGQLHTATYRFDSAWSPPDSAIHTISMGLPELTLTLTYGEWGSDFVGQQTFSGGVLTEALSGTLSHLYTHDEDDDGDWPDVIELARSAPLDTTERSIGELSERIVASFGHDALLEHLTSRKLPATPSSVAAALGAPLSRDQIWQLACRLAVTEGGGPSLTLLRSHTDPFAVCAARLLTLVGAVLLPSMPSARLRDTDARQAQLERLRVAAEAHVDAGTAHRWLEMVEVLATDWEGTTEELFTAADHLYRPSATA
jgi:hypothetical protein